MVASRVLALVAFAAALPLHGAAAQSFGGVHPLQPHPASRGDLSGASFVVLSVSNSGPFPTGRSCGLEDSEVSLRAGEALATRGMRALNADQVSALSDRLDALLRPSNEAYRRAIEGRGPPPTREEREQGDAAARGMRELNAAPVVGVSVRTVAAPSPAEGGGVGTCAGAVQVGVMARAPDDAVLYNGRRTLAPFLVSPARVAVVTGRPGVEFREVILAAVDEGLRLVAEQWRRDNPG